MEACRHCGKPIKPTDDEIRVYYLGDNMSAYKIADLLGVSSHFVYVALRRMGITRDANVARRMSNKKDPQRRFMNRIEVVPETGCWEWQGKLGPFGYGGFSIGGKTTTAHRAGWRLFKGDVPKNIEVCHKCDNPKCVNPDHMFLGTHEENMKDAWQKERFANRRILRGEGIGTSKLTDYDVLEIRRLRSGEGKTMEEIAIMFDVTKGTIWKVISGRSWRHI